MKQKFNVITSTCVPIELENIDTDQIVPARYLKATTREGFGKLLFRDWRYHEDGTEVKDFVLNDPKYKGEILVAGRAFKAIRDDEIAAEAMGINLASHKRMSFIISSFFADIHKNNELNNFVLPVVVSDGFLSHLFAAIRSDADTMVRVDVVNQSVTNLATGEQEHFELNGYKKFCLMNGLDDIDFLVANRDKVAAYEASRKQQNNDN